MGKDQKPLPNDKLRQEREAQCWLQQDVADKLYDLCLKDDPDWQIIITADQIGRWERGIKPSLKYQAKLCSLFGKSPQELGFIVAPNSESLEITSEREVLVPDSFEAESRDWATWLGTELAQIVTMVSLWHGRAAFCDELELMVDQEIKMIDHEIQQYQAGEQQAIPRRQALVTIAALPTVLTWGAGLVTDAAIEEFLPRCAASITSCWHLMKGKGFASVGGILSKFVPLLATVALRPSKYQQSAARLATQASIIRGILAMHQLNFTEREAHCREAVRYATISQDNKFQAVAQMYLGYTYSHCYLPRQPQKAIPIFHKALYDLGEEPSILRSDILMGLAEAYAQCKEEQEALRCIGLAQEHFPAYPELDPSFIYADCGLNTLYQWQGKMYLQLVEHFPDAEYQQKAASSLMQSIGIASISARSANETVIYQADAARVLGELDIYTGALRQAVQMAVNIGSRRRYQDAVLVYQRTPEKWMREAEMQELAKNVFKQAQVKKG